MTGPGTHLYLAVEPVDLPPTKGVQPSSMVVDQPFKILCSFHYFRTVNMRELVEQFDHRPMVFADSGAYSAHTQGASVSVFEYAEWLQKWKDVFTVYVNLDVIRDPAATAANQKLLE